MKDVCAEVLEINDDGALGRIFKVLWINLLGTYWDRNPFPIGSGRGAAIEHIKLSREEFEKNWRVL